jgi:hypothetical protein
MSFVNSPQRVLFRHPNEAFFYDLDGTLTGTGVVENYTRVWVLVPRANLAKLLCADSLFSWYTMHIVPEATNICPRMLLMKRTLSQGGSVKGSSFVGMSPLIPRPACGSSISRFSTQGTGGTVCTGVTFRRMWYLRLCSVYVRLCSQRASTVLTTSSVHALAQVPHPRARQVDRQGAVRSGPVGLLGKQVQRPA